jgi:hypothetical protein
MHVVLSIIAPHRLHRINIECVRKLATLAPVVPIVTKADAMTNFERHELLLDIQKQLRTIALELNRPAIFDFCESENYFLGDNYETRAPIDTLFEQQNNSDSTMLADMDQEVEHDERDASLSSSSETSCLEEVQYSQCSVPSISISFSHSSGTATVQPVADESQKPLNPVTPAALPRVRNIFAVICTLDPSHKRQYPWGEVDVLDEGASDYRRLQRLVFESGKLFALRSACQEMSMALLVKREACNHADQQKMAAIASPGLHAKPVRKLSTHRRISMPVVVVAAMLLLSGIFIYSGKHLTQHASTGNSRHGVHSG